MDFVCWKDRKSLASALKEIYRAVDADADADAAEKWRIGADTPQRVKRMVSVCHRLSLSSEGD